jgi:pilus assembly protein Flp/PilA
MLKFLRRLAVNKRGTTAIEYGLIVAFIVLAMLVNLTELASNTTAIWQRIASAYPAA